MDVTKLVEMIQRFEDITADLEASRKDAAYYKILSDRELAKPMWRSKNKSIIDMHIYSMEKCIAHHADYNKYRGELETHIKSHTNPRDYLQLSKIIYEGTVTDRLRKRIDDLLPNANEMVYAESR